MRKFTDICLVANSGGVGITGTTFVWRSRHEKKLVLLCQGCSQGPHTHSSFWVKVLPFQNLPQKISLNKNSKRLRIFVLQMNGHRETGLLTYDLFPSINYGFLYLRTLQLLLIKWQEDPIAYKMYFEKGVPSGGYHCTTLSLAPWEPSTLMLTLSSSSLFLIFPFQYGIPLREFCQCPWLEIPIWFSYKYFLLNATIYLRLDIIGFDKHIGSSISAHSKLI